MPATRTTLPAPAASPVPPGSAAPLDTGDVTGFTLVTASIDGRALTLALADDPEERGRGLMEVADLGELDGMLFAWESEVDSAFTMRNTRIPLDIAFFDGAGSLVDRLAMAPCREEPCPLYRAAGHYRWAVEAAAGAFEDLPPEARLVIKQDR